MSNNGREQTYLESSRKFSSYPKIYNLGHRLIANLFSNPSSLVVQEKVDGSQINFGVIDGKLIITSKRAVIHPSDPPNLFKASVQTILRLHATGQLIPNVVYRGEAITSCKHNALTYDTVPSGFIALFDITSLDSSTYMAPAQVATLATDLDLGVVPTLPVDDLDFSSLESFKKFIDRESYLGGTKMEGVVIKNYDTFGDDGKPLFGKYVSEAFKEVNDKSWAEQKRGKIDALTDSLANENRWRKAVASMREDGVITNTPTDIGSLMKRVKEDIVAEEIDYMKEILWKQYGEDILRKATRGVPQWYKDLLAGSQFHER